MWGREEIYWQSEHLGIVGIADMENIDLWHLSLAASEWVGACVGLGGQLVVRFVTEEAMSGGEDPVTRGLH